LWHTFGRRLKNNGAREGMRLNRPNIFAPNIQIQIILRLESRFTKVIFMTETTEFIKSRASIRKFTKQSIPREVLEDILECGRWAPSGLNNQPWFFISVTNLDTLEQLARCTSSGEIIRQSAASIAVFFDLPKGYNRTKDVQTLGACIENMLLAAHIHGLGTCWLGEILNKKEKVNAILNAPADRFELMAVIAMGYPTEQVIKRKRAPLGEVWREEKFS
jgi:nitroreductase